MAIKLNSEENTMKKVNIFGKAIPVIAIVMVVMAVAATASLVAYLSNTVTTTVTVTSPIELKIGSAWDNLGTGSLDLGSVLGGSTVQFYVSTENKANAAITGTMWNVVSNPEGVTCADFASLSAEVLHPDGTPWYPSSTIGCVAIDAYSVRMVTTPTEPWTWAALHSDIAHITVTFEEAAHGTYTVSTLVKP